MNTQDAQKLDAQLRRKRRRNSSPKKRSDFNLSLDSNNKKIISELQKNNDQENIQYTDKILRVGDEFKLFPFLIVITKKHIYLFKESSGNLKATIPINSIDSVCLSHQSDNFLLLRNKQGGDILLVTPYKQKIITVLANQWGKNSMFPLSITDRFRYRINEKTIYAVVFTRVDFGVETSIYQEKNAHPAQNKILL